MVDDTTATAPVGSPPMESWQHLQTWRAHTAVFERIGETIKRLREDVGEQPRPFASDVVIDRLPGEPLRYQVYLPSLGVAGEGRCVCEASLEAAYAFEEILKGVLEYRDWNILPAPDRSLPTWIAAAKTSFYFWLLRFLHERIPSEEATECRTLRSGLSAALS